MGVPDHLIYLLKNLYVSQETIVRIGHGKTDHVLDMEKLTLKLAKEYVKAVYCHPAYLT